ncbi:ribonuclease J [Nocardia cyriacigeorgica]|uniref:ribonuclease J n=1 Tax=Nocardia cyriacigeorgica TaxID=135487 RepID=UPI0018958CDD|nr:ribonuclease J [Nocardia cyriacigeorgica]MBF6423759.1 ribonuclease J [Nocardia cyriacigeorgica]BDT88165.1 ribonuclease J [Nocardia cyriacigeorgica]BDU07575.1 ribonuclease J [Nocardia cyriacigeorgica]
MTAPQGRRPRRSASRSAGPATPRPPQPPAAPEKPAAATPPAPSEAEAPAAPVQQAAPEKAAAPEKSTAPAKAAESRTGQDRQRKQGRSRQGGRGRGDQSAPQPDPRAAVAPQDRLGAPPKAPSNGLRVFALGGIGEIGRNMTVFEYGGKLLIVDCGVLFPEDQQPGVDLILPDFRPIENRMDDVVAVVLTHGHEDHIGAVPFLLRLRPDIPVVGSKFTLALVAAKCREHRQHPKLVEVTEGQHTTHGPFGCEYFAVNHSIPDAIAVAIRTPAGVALHTGDIKLDQLPLDGRLTDLAGFSRLGDEGVDLFLVDSTNAEVPGFVTPEREIGGVLDTVIGKAKGRVIVASFASHVHRIQQVVDVAQKYGRRICFVGRSMVRNMQIAQDLGYLSVPDGLVVELDQAATLPSDKLVLISTGSQGEPLSALSRMARGDHRQINIRADDLVVLASSLIPGNENSVFTVVNGLARLGASVITQQSAKVHVSGHASAGELLYLYNAVRPTNAMPVHGEWRHLRANAALAVATGVPEDRVVLAEDGVVVDLVDGIASIVGRVPVGHVYVDGLSVGDVGESTLSDRLVLGEGGFIAITVAIDETTGKAVSTPELSGRGFSDDPTALSEAAQLVESELLRLAGEGITDTHRIAQGVRRVVGRWVADTYRRRPMIVPTVIGV